MSGTLRDLAKVYTGFTPKYAMEGFNFAREQNTGKSAKDAFAYLSNQAPPPPLNDKAALGQWFTQYIQPGMDSLGHKVSSVGGDKFVYGNHEGNFSVDYGRGAGAEGGALAWQAEPFDAATRARYPQAGPAPMPSSYTPSGYGSMSPDAPMETWTNTTMPVAPVVPNDDYAIRTDRSMQMARRR